MIDKENTIVYSLWDNSDREPRLLGIFASEKSAQQWLDDEDASGAMTYVEHEVASIEKEEVIP